MQGRHIGAAVITAALFFGGAGSAWAGGFGTNHGNPPDKGNCIGYLSNAGDQAAFIQDVRGSGGPGAVGEAGREHGTSGGNGPYASTNCA